MQINAETLQKFCSQEWLSKSYSEYLYDCANTTAELMSDILDATNDEELDLDLNTEEEFIADSRSSIETIVCNKMIALGYPASVINVYSDEFSTVLHNLYDDGDVLITSTWQAMQTKYSKLRLSGSDIIDMFTLDADEIAITSYPVSLRAVSLTEQIASKFKMGSNAVYALGSGFVNFKNMVMNMILHGSVGLDSLPITLAATNGQDTVITDVLTDFSSIIDDMKSSFASSIAWASGFASVGMDTISNAVSNFNSVVSTMITDTTEKFAAVINNVRATVSTYAGNISSFFNQAYYQLGWKDVVDDVFTIIDATKVSEFTGASPFSSIYLKTAGDTLAATAKTIGAVAVGIFNGLLALANKGFKKVRGFLSEFTNNPQDYKIFDSNDGSFVMTNAAYHTLAGDQMNLSFHVSTGLGPQEDDEISDKFLGVVRRCANSWYSFDTHFGILSFRFTGVAAHGDGDVDCGVDIVYKPKALWYSSLESAGLMHFYKSTQDPNWAAFGNSNIGSTGILNFNTWLENGDLFFHDDMDGATELVEGCNILGFNASIMMFRYLAHECMLEINAGLQSKYGFQVQHFTDNVSSVQHWFRADTYPSVLVEYWQDSITPADNVVVPSDINNEVFAKTCSGDWSHGSSDDYDKFYYYNSGILQRTPTPSYGYIGLIEIVGGFLCAFLVQQYDKHESPTEYFWLPYCKDSYANDCGRYKIISDAEHANVVGIVTAALIVIVAVVSVVILGATVVKLFKARKLTKWASRQGVLDNKMWNGGKLTAREQLKYLRAVKKNNSGQNATSGLAGSVAAATNAVKQANAILSGQASANADDSMHNASVTDASFSELMSVKKSIAY